MSLLLKNSPRAFGQYENLTPPEAGAFTAATEARRRDCELGCSASATPQASSVLLRDDHLVLLTIDRLLALRTAFQKWRKRRKTLRALADLDERQLHDIGLTRDQAHYRALAELEGAHSESINSKVLGGWK
jgi:uncharacterized protein YjiS (DUF1127 family)